VQWNVVRAQARVLRGVHGHWRHRDYLLCIAGRMQVGLRDLRRDSPTRGLAAVVEHDAERPSAIVIPTGVAHGFYYPEPAIHAYAVTETWNPDDELGCRFDDPQLGLRWPDASPRLSQRDSTLGSMAELERELHERMGRGSVGHGRTRSAGR
jgi:dTDP-4-dehydrorhamnose 3,5-epimerase